MSALAFVDIETTGLDPARHEIWDIGLIIDKDGKSEEHQWYLPVTLTTADSMALKIGKFYERHPDYREDRPSPAYLSDLLENHKGIAHPSAVAAKIARLTAGAHLVGNVVSFDAGFLNLWMRKNEAAPCWHYHLVDCEALVAGHKGFEPPWKSSELSQAVNVDPPDKDEAHSALADARWARAMYYSVLGGEPFVPPQATRPLSQTL